MDKSLRVILAVALVSFLSVGLVMSGCSGDSGADISGLGRITSCPAGSSSIQIGEPAPDFWFETAQGQTTSLSELKGKIVLVNFWATWCGPCIHEMPFLQQIYDEWSEEELVMLVINLGESSGDVVSFMQDNGLSFPILLDSEGEAGTCYGVRAIPTTLFIDKEGIIQNVQIGSFSSKEQIESILNQLR